MIRTVRYALLPAILCFAAHAEIGNKCNLTPDMDYILVETFDRSDEEWAETRVVGPDWKVGVALWPPAIADHVSLQEGKEWFGLRDETPVYCEVNIRQTYKSSPGTIDRINLYIFSMPKDRWWGSERSQGVQGYFGEIDQGHRHENVGATVSVRVDQAARAWLGDYYARLEREIRMLEERQARLQEREEELAEQLGGGGPAADSVAGEDHFLAVATSPAAGTRIRPGEPGYFGIGWHTESQHDAGLTAEDACRRQGVGKHASPMPAGSRCVADALDSPWRLGATGTRTRNAHTS